METRYLQQRQISQTQERTEEQGITRRKPEYRTAHVLQAVAVGQMPSDGNIGGRIALAIEPRTDLHSQQQGRQGQYDPFGPR